MSKNKNKDIDKNKKIDKNKDMKTRTALIKEHHFILWLILFFPVALFKSFKYKILPKWLNIILTFLFGLFFIVILDTMINPTRVADNEVEKQLIKMENDIGTIISIEQYEIVDDYYVYDVITNQARYDVYIDALYEIKAIKMISNDSSNVYESDDFKDKYKGVYSEIIKFVNNNELDISNNIEKIVNTTTKQQTLIIDDVEYTFDCAYENINIIYDKDSNIIYKNDELSLRLNEEMFAKVNKNFPQTKDLDYASTIVFNDDSYEIYFYTKDGNLYKLQVFISGKISVSIATDINNSNKE